MHVSVRAANPPPSLSPSPSPYVEVPDYTIPAPTPDQAQIIFLQPAGEKQGLFLPVGIFQIEGEQRTLLNFSSWRSKSVINLPPGKHLLMTTHGGNCMETNVAAGNRYYVLLQFADENIVRMRPIRASGLSVYSVNSPQFGRWMNATKLFVKKSSVAEEYIGRFGTGIDRVQLRGLKKWRAKSAEEAAEFTLNVEDAVPL